MINKNKKTMELTLKNGHLDMPVPDGIDFRTEIKKLQKEKNAVILAHYYTTDEVQEIADYTGDSLGLAQQAAKTDADIIVFAGVHFMAETAKVLCPDKKVLIPDLATSCSLADSINEQQLRDLKAQYPDHTVISYVNTTAEIKALTDIVVTSSNAVKIVSQLPEDEKIIFGPDQNLGNYVQKVTGRKNMVIWNGGCHVHHHFDSQALKKLREENPDAKVLAHPECPETILSQADFVGATSFLLKMSVEQPDEKFIVATEPGIFYEMKKRSPHKTFIPVPNENGARLNVCINMKRNSLKKIYLTLKYEFPQVDLPKELSEKAVVCINRMMEMSK